MPRWFLAACALALVLADAGPGVNAAPAKKPAAATAPEPKAKPKLPAAAREMLLGKMRTHRTDMERLLKSVLLLDHPVTAELATRIAEGDRLARPTAETVDSLNSLVPPPFFDLQDQLRDNARDLAAAAAKNDDKGIALAFGKTTQTCVACHALFFDGK